MSAPAAMASATVAAPPATREAGGSCSRPSAQPIADLRELPSSSGRPRLRSSPSRRTSSRLCSGPKPKPKPGSRISCSRDTPAASAIASDSSRPARTSAITSPEDGRPRWLCISTAGSPRAASSGASAGSARRACTSLSASAPASKARPATYAFEVSTLIGAATASRTARSTGARRAHSPGPSRGSWPGRVDSAPTSIRSAPSSTIRAACSAAAAGSSTPSPEKESGVALTMPIT